MKLVYRLPNSIEIPILLLRKIIIIPFNSPNIYLIIIMHKSDLSSSLSSIKYKIVLLGDSGVGKSSIIDRFARG